MTLGQKVRDLRRHKGLSQELLADLSKTSLKTIQRIEHNLTNPRSYTLKSISHALEVAPESLRDFDTLPEEESQDEIIDFEMVRKINFACLTGLLVPFCNIVFPIYYWNRLKPDRPTSAMIRRMIGFQVLLTLTTILVIFLRPIVLMVFMENSSNGQFPTSVLLILLAIMIDLVVLLRISVKLQRSETSVLTSLSAVF
ncbi:MAG: helix-turn-helix transcriptional regulator [Roseivirga sp.]|nr:helix-turn-helix transcriptional regulator [Roseivirga sp.]